MSKFRSPLPQALPKECAKAAQIVKAFVDRGNNGLDGIIPRHVLDNAKGFAIFTIFKAGFLFSARAGSGVVIARLPSGSWSAPSAIGTAGLGVGGQAGAEMTDFLIVLNTSAAVRSFMAAGSLTLGGNMSIALGPMGRNGEAFGSVNSGGKIAAMYSHSKTRGLFGGVSLEGSVIVERQDANRLSYGQNVTAKMLLSGVVDPPDWASPLIKTLEACIGMPGGKKWVQDSPAEYGYAFGEGIGSGSSRNSIAATSTVSPSSTGTNGSASRPNWLRRQSSLFSTPYNPAHDSYNNAGPQQSASTLKNASPFGDTTSSFETRFDSDFDPDDWRKAKATQSPQSVATTPLRTSSSAGGTHARSDSVVSQQRSFSSKPSWEANTSSLQDDLLVADLSPTSGTSSRPFIAPKAGLNSPLSAGGVGRAIALYNFQAVQPGDLSFKKGDVITITKKSQKVEDWWSGKIENREGVFPANFVEVV